MKNAHWKIQTPIGPYWIQYCLPNNTTLLVMVEKFNPNPVLVNINKQIFYKTSDVAS
jgi:hypothetical protein